MVRNSLTVVQFTATALRDELTKAGHRVIPDQVGHIERYLETLGAQTIVVESHYIDRHYLDEYALYYCRNLSPLNNYVTRVHAFGAALAKNDFFDLLSRFIEERQSPRDLETTESYLGFISIRPVSGAPIGRTILRRLPPESDPTREIGAMGKHTVHLANLELTVEGLPFQQQDRAVGACATAALWSALGRVARRDGLRSPTPAEVTEAAARFRPSDGRNLPANRGLTLEQLCEAVRCCNLAAETVRADHHIEYFFAALHTYLLSGMPVLLALMSIREGHAVTAAGYQLAESPDSALDSHLPFRSARLNKIYVHDDRVMPYARASLVPVPYTGEYGEGVIFDIDGEDWLITALLAPVYPKLRLSVESLIELGEILASLVETAVTNVKQHSLDDLSVEFEYQRSGTFLRSLNGRIGKSSVGFLAEVSLSRWCAIVRWYLDDEPAFEFVYDTTDIPRDNGRGLLRAVLCLQPEYKPELETIAVELDAPFASR